MSGIGEAEAGGKASTSFLFRLQYRMNNRAVVSRVPG